MQPLSWSVLKVPSYQTALVSFKVCTLVRSTSVHRLFLDNLINKENSQSLESPPPKEIPQSTLEIQQSTVVECRAPLTKYSIALPLRLTSNLTCGTANAAEAFRLLGDQKWRKGQAIVCPVISYMDCTVFCRTTAWRIFHDHNGFFASLISLALEEGVD